MHLTDDELILHFYGEGDATDEARIDDHLRTCAACRALFADLRETMQMVDAAVVPEADLDFERRIWERVQTALPDTHHAKRWAARQWAPVLAWAALILAMVWVGYRGLQPSVTPTPATAPVETLVRDNDAKGMRERVLLAALDTHFQQTEMLLVELLNSPEDGGESAFERATADELVASGRLYRMSAQQSGNRQFAQMLDDLEAVLVEVARSPEKPSALQVRSMRARVDDNGLLFKVRAVNNEIRDRQQSLKLASE